MAYINKNEIYKLFSESPAIVRLHVTQIDELPDADVAEVKHGKWISKGTGFAWRYICSECGWEDGYPFNDRHRFCPNCGAKMDGELRKEG